jgi:hypothetical protein
MKKTTKRLLAASALLVLLTGGALTWIARSYDPILFGVDNLVFRQSDWNALKPKLFNGVAYTLNEEVHFLEQRSLEELVLAKARQMNIKADEDQVERQFQQLASTPQELEQKLKEMNTTAEEVKNNYRRALTAFALKTEMTKDIKVAEEEIAAYYEQNKDFFFAPEFRSIYYIRAKKTDQSLTAQLQAATADNFPALTKQLNNEALERLGTWHELESQSHFATHTSEKIAEVAFQTPVGKLVGPMEDGQWNYWFMPNEIKPPYQLTLQESRNKIHSILLQEKQVASYRIWLNSQKDSVGYYFYPENLSQGRLSAFWHDLPKNLSMFF